MLEDILKPISAFLQITSVIILLVVPGSIDAQTTDKIPRLVEQDGRHALIVDGAPFLVLGAQIGNSSAWPSLLEQKMWPAFEAMHVNTAEAPVYWDRWNPSRGDSIGLMSTCYSVERENTTCI